MLTLILLLLLNLPSAGNASLTVEITGLRSDKGTVIIRLWQDKDTWLKKEGVVLKVKSPIQNGRILYELNDLKPGKYALAFVHDENNNGHLDFNFARLPKEGTGASNNASATFGPPSFEDALFGLNAGESKFISIKAKYYL